MPDVREIYKALSPEDRLSYQQFRLEMRRTYINAHNQTLGVQAWDCDDDQFLDLLDIKLATLYDRAGFISGVKDVIGKEDAEAIEQKIEQAEDALKAAHKKQPLNEQSQATELLARIGHNGDKNANGSDKDAWAQ